jgi:hypothetical protein
MNLPPDHRVNPILVNLDVCNAFNPESLQHIYDFFSTGCPILSSNNPVLNTWKGWDILLPFLHLEGRGPHQPSLAILSAHNAT